MPVPSRKSAAHWAQGFLLRLVDLKPIGDCLAEALIVLDAGGFVVYANQALCELIGADRVSIVGKPSPFPCCLERDTPTNLDCADCSFLTKEAPAYDGRYCYPSTGRHPARIQSRTINPRPGKDLVRIVLVQSATPTSVQSARDLTTTRRVHRLEMAIVRIAQVMSELGVHPVFQNKFMPPAVAANLQRLTRREWEVLRCLLENHRVKAIASSLFISEHTVRNHLKSIFKKLGVGSQTELLELLDGHEARS